MEADSQQATLWLRLKVTKGEDIILSSLSGLNICYGSHIADGRTATMWFGLQLSRGEDLNGQNGYNTAI